jgi:putative membrane protein
MEMDMRNTLLVMLSAGALALGGCDHRAETAANDTASVTSETTTTAATDNGGLANSATGNAAISATPAGQAFANTAAASDAFEIATSQLAATNAKSSSIKSFASKMIEAHTASTTKLKTAAANTSPAIAPDPTLTPDQQQKVDMLKGLTGENFDVAYATAQIDAHQQTLDGLKIYAESGDIPSLKTFAIGLIPTVTAHLNMAKALKP